MFFFKEWLVFYKTKIFQKLNRFERNFLIPKFKTKDISLSCGLFWHDTDLLFSNTYLLFMKTKTMDNELKNLQRQKNDYPIFIIISHIDINFNPNYYRHLNNVYLNSNIWIIKIKYLEDSITCFNILKHFLDNEFIIIFHNVNKMPNKNKNIFNNDIYIDLKNKCQNNNISIIFIEQVEYINQKKCAQMERIFFSCNLSSNYL